MATFGLTLFILLMQFLWKYIDDFVGKGLEWYVIAKLLVLASTNLVPLALPLGVLLASIMCLGNMAENYELVALKSTGASLMRILRPLFIFVGVLSIGSLLFSNYVSPSANLKFKTLLWDVTQKKPALEIKEGVFYNDIDNYSIRVAEKTDDNWLLDVLIYDHSERSNGNKKVLRAEKGKMTISQNQQFLLLELYDGYNYEETTKNTRFASDLPQIKSHFEKQSLKITLSGFGLKESDEGLFKNSQQMLSLPQLLQAADSIDSKIDKKHKEWSNYYDRSLLVAQDTSSAPVSKDLKLDKSQLMSSVYVAQSLVRNAKNYNKRTYSDLKIRHKQKNRYLVEYHQKWVLAIACLLLFFVGAPLGAIIKKGGLGLPVVFSVLFFLVFYVLLITGSKMSVAGVMPTYIGMWLNTMVLFPIAIFLTIKANSDSALFDRAAYTRFFNKLKVKKANA